MSRLQPVAYDAAPESSRLLLDGVKKKLGRVPNLMQTLAHSPAALEGYLQLSGAVGKGRLSPKQREQISLTVAQANDCDYCLAAHSTIGRMVGLSADQVREARLGNSSDPQTAALLRFVRKVVELRGKVDDDDVAEFRAAGFDEGAVAEAVANVAVNLFTNYFNHTADTEVDFPAAEPLEAQHR